MFDALKERMKHDHEAEFTRAQRMMQTVVVIVLSVCLFGGLYFVVRILE